MRRHQWQILGGILLIAAGILLLLARLGNVDIGAWAWAVLLGGAGLAFLYVFLADREQWWALIPGFTLFSTGVLIALAQGFPDLEGGALGAIVPAGISAAFWLIYFLRRDYWWAIIPAGVLLSAALVTALSSTLSAEASSGILFLGLALTFGLLAFIETPRGRFRWALIPAGVLVIMGLISLAAASLLSMFVWPAVIILIGLFLLARVLGFRRT